VIPLLLPYMLGWSELPLGYEPVKDFPKRFAISLGTDGYAEFESNHLRDRQAPAHQATKWQGISRIKMIEVDGEK
jgi:hypothetical protein